MARKPQPGGDRNAWGRVLNEFIDVAHNPDGTIKPAGVQTAVSTEVETALAVQLPPAVAQEVAAQPTVAAAAAAAVDADPRISSLISDVADVDDRVTANIVTTDVLAALRFDPEHPNYGAQRGDATEPGAIVKAANRAAIQLAADDARDSGGTLVLKGDYWIDDTIQIECHVDGASGTLRISNTNINPAVIVGRSSSNLSARQIMLPAIRQMGRTVGTGWGGNDVGLRVNRLNQSNLWITLVQNFSVNVEMYAETGGTSYNNIYLGMIHNGKIGMDFQTAPTSGWVNENLFFGGRFVIDTAEGTNIPGCRHIRVPNAPSGHLFNNNMFIKPSIEGSAPEYHVETGGAFNYIVNGRWEVIGGSAKLLWANDAHSWVIDGGYNLHTVEFHTAPGNSAANCRVRHRSAEYWRASGSGVLRYANSGSDASPVMLINPGGSTFWTRDLTTDYYISIAGTAMKFKNFSDAHPRLEIQSATGNLVFGSGSVAPSYRLEVNQFGNMIWRGGALFVEGAIVPSNGTQSTARIYAGEADPNGSQSAGPGSLYLRTNGTIYRKGTGTGNTGWVAMS